jgi:uncharacterized membrane protein YdcZ (DUF606 family)
MTQVLAQSLINFLVGQFFLYIYNLPAEQQAKLLPPWETGYQDPNWTAKECEF